MIRHPLLLGSLVVAFSVDAEPVRLLSLDWGSQQVITKALGRLLEQQGIEVEIVYASSQVQWYKLAQGEADVQVEVWQGSMGPKYDEMIAKGFIQQGTVHNVETREEWWYPDYVEALCPGLPNWEALKNCAHLFSYKDSERGVYYSGPWEKPDAAKIRALGLNYRVELLEDGDAINRKLRDYIAKQKPLLIYNWTPNWVEAKYPGSFVEFPRYDEACELDPSWGVNSKYTWDCGNPRGAWLKTAISNQLRTKSACAFDIVSSFTLSSQHIATASLLIDNENQTLDQAADNWLNQFQHQHSDWIEHSSCLTR
ncbi:ABC transporter substrate-binding protein [Vibrio brasiliensis]|uniref:ABC transporter substrate-binding protein n=1 Tax=Vibrio brasiliensis TaxID=170652 RepID=UPI001EFC3DA3|nr:ABC transporter substrate-binding protein [Vibrio brasiliensis]MCG9647329.1 ABC transporter substrate-binding protein [Vibrio brasiliensis]